MLKLHDGKSIIYQILPILKYGYTKFDKQFRCMEIIDNFMSFIQNFQKCCKNKKNVVLLYSKI